MKLDAMRTTLRIRRLGARALAFLGAALLLAPGTVRAVDLEVETGATYNGWRGSDGSHGSQFTVPVRISGALGDFSATLLTAYAYTGTDDDRGLDETVGTLLDTKVGGTYALVRKLPVDLLFGLDLNVPTGKTDLSRDELRLSDSLDPELVSVTTLGEGFNVNPTLTLAKVWGSVGAGLGFGYLWRGSYDASSTLQDFDPGDLANLTGELRWAFAPDWEGRVLGKYARYGRDHLDGEETFREGDFASLLLGVRRTADRWGTALTLQGIYRGKSEILDGSGDLGTEDENSHGTEYRGTVTFQYSPTASTGLTTSLAGLFVTHNGYSDSESRYVGSRKKVSLTLGGSHRFTPVLEGRLGVCGFWMDDDEMNFPSHKDSTIYRGVAATANLYASF
jgi:hypothetical protein